MPPPITTTSTAVPSSPASRLVRLISSSTLDQLRDRSYHVIRRDRADSRVAGRRDAAQHENGGQAETLSHRDVRLDAVADDHRLAGRHAERGEGDLEDDKRGLAHDALHRLAGDG